MSVNGGPAFSFGRHHQSPVLDIPIGRDVDLPMGLPFHGGTLSVTCVDSGSTQVYAQLEAGLGSLGAVIEPVVAYAPA